MQQIIKKTFIVFLSLMFMMKDVYSLGHEGARDSNFDHQKSSFCDTGDLGDFDPLGASNRDMEWVMSNPTCYGFVASYGAAIVSAGFASSYACGTTPAAGMYSGSAANSAFYGNTALISPHLAVRAAAASADCIRKWALASGALATQATACGNPAYAALCPTAQTQSTAATGGATSCCSMTGVYIAAIGTGVGALGSLFAVAQDTYNKARICGHDWYSWQEFNVDGNAQTGGGYWRRGSYNYSYSKLLNDVYVNGNKVTDSEGNVIVPNQTASTTINPNNRSLAVKEFREFFYGGKEFTDSSGGCSPPANWDSETRITRLGYDDNNQRYYMRGPGIASNYACYRYLSSGTNPPSDEERAAYDCCVARSQNTLCIENETQLARTFGDGGYKSKFCKVGEQCMVSAVGFIVENSQSQTSTICAQTKTLCPYDHLIGGGTEYRDISEIRNGDVITPRVSNYCQFNKHCVKVPARPYIRITNLSSAFISSACMNFVGHSQNVYSNTNELLPVSNIKNFSAPLVECMAQTIKNMIQNRAGYTQCSDPDESPQRSGSQYICENGYDFREGDRLLVPGPFEKFQQLLRTVIKVVLALSITFLGYSILLALKPIEGKTILIFIVKLALVIYFALGNGWQQLFVDSVFNISSELAGIVMKFDDESLINNPGSQNRLDGCQFPKFNADLVRNPVDYPDAASDPFYAVSDPGQRKYTAGYEYLKPWDTLDCKFVRALGFGPEMSVPNLILTILAGLFTGGLGIMFAMFTFMFAFLYVAMIIRALHIFLVSTIAIAILIMVSPITITAILFKKTKSIFDGWLKQLLGFIIQPVVLFAYIAIFVGIMDYSVYGIRHDLPNNGGITFAGNGLDTPKGTFCDGDAYNNSIFCIFGMASNTGTYSGLEKIGILVPVLFNMNKEKLNTIIQAGLLMFIFSKFMDKISDVAADLTGSSKISSKTPSATAIAMKAGGIARGVQKRGTRVAGRAISGGAKKVGRAAAALSRIKAKVSEKNSDSSE